MKIGLSFERLYDGFPSLFKDTLRMMTESGDHIDITSNYKNRFLLKHTCIIVG